MPLHSNRPTQRVPSVTNGLALSKLHHAAFDSCIIGTSPERMVEVRHTGASSSLCDNGDRHTETSDVDRELGTLPGGRVVGNHACHSSFIPAKSSGSRRMNVALTMLFSELPAASRTADTFFKHRRVCSWTVPRQAHRWRDRSPPDRTRTPGPRLSQLGYRRATSEPRQWSRNPLAYLSSVDVGRFDPPGGSS